IGKPLNFSSRTKSEEHSNFISSSPKNKLNLNSYRNRINKNLSTPRKKIFSNDDLIKHNSNFSAKSIKDVLYENYRENNENIEISENSDSSSKKKFRKLNIPRNKLSDIKNNKKSSGNLLFNNVDSPSTKGNSEYNSKVN